MKLIVGLGNPGPEYARTRHNAGVLALQRLARRHGMGGEPGRVRFHALVAEGAIAGQRCLLALPQTYMNRSGLTVGEAVTFYKLDPTSDLMVIVDDTALPLGKIRIRGEGSAGGHNGLKDIQSALANSIQYPRLRIGIDPPGRVPQVDYVLQRFSEDQLKTLDPALDLAADAIECWLKEGMNQAMTRFNA